jgi:hypothetical protein
LFSFALALCLCVGPNDSLAVVLSVDDIDRELRNSLDTLRQETDKQARYHISAKQIFIGLQGQVAAFNAGQVHHGIIHQAVIEKEHQAKQTQESSVNTAREKYEADRVRIHSSTTQSPLVPGQDLEKTQSELERAQQPVPANETDFADSVKALQDATQMWEQNWKAFCDSCQDLEEKRLKFMKDRMWEYANAVSALCVNDDNVSLHSSQ